MEKVKRYKHDSEVSYTLGMTITMELLINKPEIVQKVYLHSSIKDNQNVEKLKALCEKYKIEMVQSDKVFNILSDKGNCFVIGEFKKYNSQLNDANSHIVLVNPSDLGNIGNILRTATAFGFYDIAIIKPAGDAFDPKAVRASMGALFHTRVQYFDDIESYMKKFNKHNLYSFMLTASKPIYEVKFEEPYSLVFGNEAHGLPEVFANFSKTVIIPQTENVDSLNLTIASSIAMYVAKYSGCGIK